VAHRPDLSGASPITPDLRQNDGLTTPTAWATNDALPGVFSNKNISKDVI